MKSLDVMGPLVYNITIAVESEDGMPYEQRPE
jgi:hypothetical protein